MGQGRRFYMFFCKECGTEFWAFPNSEDYDLCEYKYEKNELYGVCVKCEKDVKCKGFSMIPEPEEDIPSYEPDYVETIDLEEPK
jgi:hypothetical protein